MNTAVSISSVATIVLVSGLFVRGIVFYFHDDIGRAVFWLIAGIAANTVMNWIVGALHARASKDFADYVQGTDKKE